MKKTKVLLIGPKIGFDSSSYGQGFGGYTRNMALYLKEFQFDDITLSPFYCSQRKLNDINFISFPIRFIKDVIGFISKLILTKIDIVHILGVYLSALPREVCWVVIAKIFRKKIVYEIKAGSFISASEKNKMHLWLSNIILHMSDLILVEGKIYIDYVYTRCGKKAIYFPNIVSYSEIAQQKEIQINYPLRILFVGFCYEGKGIYDLVIALNSQKLGLNIQLEIVGAESLDFSNWITNLPENPKVKIIRYGVRPHEFVLDRMGKNTIYLYPSRHKGEGHNNTINEAMMNSMIIVASKAGFMEDIIRDCGFLIDTTNNVIENIENSIIEIISNPEIAKRRAQNGRRKIETTYNSKIQGKVLEKLYSELVNGEN